MTEIHFVVEEAPEGGLTARAVGSDVFTEADDLKALRVQVRDAVHCHFEAGQAPALIRLLAEPITSRSRITTRSS